MAVTFSLVYPTRHRPEFVRQALRILETQGHDSFEVVVCDNYVDPALSCEAICRDSRVANVRYVHPPRPVGMVENWNHAVPFATGDYMSFLTDKMFVLPGALGRIKRAIDLAGAPEIVSWTSDSYSPASYPDYFGEGLYVRASSEAESDVYRTFRPQEELSRRGRAEVSRGEQSPLEYSRGKLAFGAYRRELVDRIVRRFGALFHNINPDYTSMVVGLAEARDAVEMARSCIVSVNTDISNGMLCDTNDATALAFLNSLAGGAESILPKLLVPGLYVSVHNWVAHDYLSLKTEFDLPFEFNMVNWLVYCTEDVYRPGRRWSDPRIEAEQKRILRDFVESLGPDVGAAVRARRASRPRLKPRPLPRRVLRRLVPPPVRRLRWRLADSFSPSIQAAVERSVAMTN